MEKQFAGKGYGEFKGALADVVVEAVINLQQRFKELRSDESNLIKVLEDGARVATEQADAKLAIVKEKVGLL